MKTIQMRLGMADCDWH